MNFNNERDELTLMALAWAANQEPDATVRSEASEAHQTLSCGTRRSSSAAFDLAELVVVVPWRAA